MGYCSRLAPGGCADLRKRDRPVWLLLAVAYPAVFVNLGHGHNGFLTAALMGGALVHLDRRPWLAGILFGLLAYKPQFGLMIPLVLVVTGRWRTIAAAAATVLALAAATTLVFGVDVWTAFLEGTRFTRIVVLEAGEHRLAQDSEHLRVGADVGRVGTPCLCGAGGDDPRGRLRCLPGSGAAPPTSPSKRRRSRSQHRSPRPTASTTT